jgi:RNA polymerase sigma factor (TIGR02999 family)
VSADATSEEAEKLACIEATLADLQLPNARTDAVSLMGMVSAVYDDLRGMAGGYLRGERAGHTLQPTALVHEAYVRLSEQDRMTWQNRAHFLCIAARMMRRVLTNHATARTAEKRGGEDLVRFTLDETMDFYQERDMSLQLVDEALGRLETLDARQARIVELRFFGGLTVEEIGEVLDLSPRTVKREWSTAKHWLRREITAAA